MQTVILCEDVLDPGSWERHDVEDVRDFLVGRFDRFPATARIYAGQVAEDCDVTPSDEAGIQRLAELEGVLYVVVYPGDPITILIAVVAVAAAAAVAFLLMPQVPNAALRNTQTESPNNELSNRQNQPRPAGRIPDIFGTVRSTPDLLAVPYKVFQDHEEVEYAFMCVGRGSYDVPAAEVRDDDTKVSAIAGASVEVYGPGTSPNSGDEPQLRIGTAIEEPVLNVTRSTVVNGQTLRPPNADSFRGEGDVRFNSPDEIQAKSGEEIDFTKYFTAGDTLSVTGATYTGTVSGSGVSLTTSMRFVDGGTVELETASTTDFEVGDAVQVRSAFFTYNSGANAVDLSGSYVVASKTASTLTFVSPETSNSDWNLLAGNFVDDSTAYKSCDLEVAAGSTTVDLAGEYTVLTVTSDIIVLSNPSVVNADWAVLDGFPDDRTGFLSPTLSTSGGQLSATEEFWIDTSLRLRAVTGSSLDFTTLFGVGDLVEVRSEGLTPWAPPSFLGLLSGNTADVAGYFEVTAVTAGTLTFKDPASVASNWTAVAEGSPFTATVTRLLPKWVGPFTLAAADIEEVISNFVALNGLYKDNGERQRRVDVGVQLEVTPVNSSDVATGPSELFTAVLDGSETSRATRGVTMRASPAAFTGRCSVRACRLTPTDLEYEGTVVDEVKWRDVYSASPVSQEDFGDVTTVQAVTYATAGALALKDRKLNMLVTREVPIRTTGTSFGALAPTNRVDHILAAVCLDRRIGNRDLREVDLDSIYDTVAEAEAYFGSSLAVEFCYTFDSDNMSFEETVASIASAVFSVAYRQGSLIRLKLERATEDSVLLFNHRNKLPGSETRTIRFGNQDQNDGVEYEWIDPEDDALVTLYLPEDQSAVSPRKVESMGVRNYLQAFQHANRIWNKVRYQNTATEFEATQEAELLVLTDRILVADNTRPDTQDGQVEDQDGLELELSQALVLEDGTDYVIFLQHVDGSVESIPITAGADAYHVLLSRAPRSTLVTDETYFAKATFQVVPRTDAGEKAFMLSERSNLDRMTSSVSATNYSPRFYLEEGLNLRMVQGHEDASGFRRTLTPSSAAADTVVDAVRGLVHRGGTTSGAQVAVSGLIGTLSYSVAAWIRKDTLGGTFASGVLSSTTGAGASVEQGILFPSSDTIVQMRHRGDIYLAAQWPAANAWHHLVVTYDAATGDAAMYIDGEEADTAASVPQRTLGPLAVGNYSAGLTFVGRLDDVRHYCRALSEEDARALYRSSRA